MKHTEIKIYTIGTNANPDRLLAMCAPLMPAAEFLEGLMIERQLLTPGRKLVWSITAGEANTSNVSGSGTIFWESLGKTLGSVDVLFNLTGYLSLDGKIWDYPTTHSIIVRCADILESRQRSLAPAGDGHEV